ncbi:hypothetical protein E3P89_00718 [Wallemia ichthyophaga]|uniref:Cysteine protease n=1 Tax=Wallemia ichthyophaga TaxID=245174 RepID=A0A4T0I6X9_WALIC|nr:hypothetical protein E3P90_00986 [Wallemia ichthyophaga]TIB16904.1 hypothetical protein E3P93_00843 [Wallemia ichthyophaga]TIB24968.1 hypothetical protein E3P89_00718 [Wallemia ichthyophaga]TIB26632.1 hypothetical protein E3P88_00855 [Wallemia ichthyophaga]
MAVVGKSLGKEIGEWFGPSTAALTIRHLVNNQHDVDLSVSVASDSVIYKSDVYQASGASTEWGHKPVLILVGIRLGLDGVHPRYYETLKAFLRIKSCVGIAGGRPSSSYYFFGYQSDSLFYVDPHMIKPAMTTRVPPSEAELKTEIESLLRCNSASSGSTSGSTSTSDKQPGTKSTPSTPNTTPTKHLSKNGHRRRKTSMMLGGVTNKNRRRSSSSATLGEEGEIEDCLPSSSSQSSQDDSVGWKKLSHFPSTSSHSVPQTIPESSSSSFIKDIPNLDELSDKWYIDTYSGSTISSYFCDKPRKMNMNQMDPSMLLGFVVRDGEEFDRFVREVRELPQQIFSVADAPRSFGDDEDVQSISSSSSSSNVGASVAQAQDEEWSNIRKESMEEEGAELVDRMKLSDRGTSLLATVTNKEKEKEKMSKPNEQVIEEFNKIVNITVEELESFLNTEESKNAGWGEGDESVGHNSGRHIVDILTKNPEKKPESYDEGMLEHMRKIVAYCNRHIAGEMPSLESKSLDEIKHSKSYLSLKNWGHDVLKYLQKEDKPAEEDKEKSADDEKREDGTAEGEKQAEKQEDAPASAEEEKKQEDAPAAEDKQENGHEEPAQEEKEEQPADEAEDKSDDKADDTEQLAAEEAADVPDAAQAGDDAPADEELEDNAEKRGADASEQESPQKAQKTDKSESAPTRRSARAAKQVKSYNEDEEDDE